MLHEIERRLPELSRAERRVAAWVLAHPREAAKRTLADVATASGTSEPTVIRFCRRVGADGFRELARRLTEALSKPVSYVHRDVRPDDATSDAVAKVLDSAIQSLLDTRAELSGMPFDQAVAAMRDARQLTFVGLGASGHVAGDAHHKFFRLGLPCSSITDSPTILQFAAIAARGDVLFVMSHTGAARELSEAARLARQGGATAIALTDPESALARQVDYLFPCRTVEDTGIYTPMRSRLAQLAVLDALQVALALALGEAAIANLKRSKEVLRLHLSR